MSLTKFVLKRHHIKERHLQLIASSLLRKKASPVWELPGVACWGNWKHSQNKAGKLCNCTAEKLELVCTSYTWDCKPWHYTVIHYTTFMTLPHTLISWLFKLCHKHKIVWTDPWLMKTVAWRWDCLKCCMMFLVLNCSLKLWLFKLFRDDDIVSIRWAYINCSLRMIFVWTVPWRWPCLTLIHPAYFIPGRSGRGGGQTLFLLLP